MTPQEMYAEFQSYLDGDANFMSGDEGWRKLYSANREVIRLINREDPTYFVQTHTFDTVADQALYDLPQNARLGSRIVFVENTDTVTEMPPVQELRELLSFEAPGVANLSNHHHFILQGSKVRVMGTPGGVNSIRVYYLPQFGNMIQGRISATTSTTLDFFAGDPNYTQNYGIPDPRNDFYNGMTVLLTKNDGVGDQRTVTDYTGGVERQITVDSAWSTTLDASEGTTTEFAILSPVPEDFHQLIPLRAAIDGAIKNRNRLKEIQSVYFGTPGRPGLDMSLLGWLQARQMTGDEIVVPVDHGM